MTERRVFLELHLADFFWGFAFVAVRNTTGYAILLYAAFALRRALLRPDRFASYSA